MTATRCSRTSPPSGITAPLPNCFSIAATAAATAFSFSVSLFIVAPRRPSHEWGCASGPGWPGRAGRSLSNRRAVRVSLGARGAEASRFARSVPRGGAVGLAVRSKPSEASPCRRGPRRTEDPPGSVSKNLSDSRTGFPRARPGGRWDSAVRAPAGLGCEQPVHLVDRFGKSATGRSTVLGGHGWRARSGAVGDVHHPWRD